MDLTSTTARAKEFGSDNGRSNTTWTFDLKQEEDAVYLYVSGPLAGYKPSEFKALYEDNDINSVNISVYVDHPPYTIYPRPDLDANHIDRVLTIEKGMFTVKFNVTTLPFETYGIASQNNGYGDIYWGANQPKNVLLNGRNYVLNNSGGKAQLAITPDWTGVTAAVTSISLSLDNADAAQATKVLLTYEGTYSGCTKETIKGLLEAKYSGRELFYFYANGLGFDTITGYTVVTDENTWKVIIDVTDLPVCACRNLDGFKGMKDASPDVGDLKYSADIVHATDITFKGKIYHLVLANDWGNNGLNVEAVAE